MSGMTNQIKTYVLGALGLIVIVGFIWWGTSQTERSESITVGAILPLTGSGSDQGEWVKRGLELAVKEINARRESNIELVFEDSAGDPKKAVTTYQNHKSRYQMPVVITWGSGVGLALTPLVNQDKIIQMGVATAASAYSTPDDFTFRNFPDSAHEAQYIVDVVLNKLKTDRVAILKMNNDYGVSSAKGFREQYEKQGGKVLIEDVFEPGTTDFRTQLSKIKGASPSVVYLATYPKEGGLLLRQAKELGITTQFIASVAILGGREFFDLAGDSAEGLLIVTSAPVFSDDAAEPIRSFVKSYEEKYHEDLSAQHLYVARAYDAMKVLSFALDQCGTKDTDCIRRELFDVKNYPGVSGRISFDRNGDIDTTFNLQVVRNGLFLSYD